MAFPVQPEMPPINNALYRSKFKETTKIEEAMSPGTHRLDSSVNWDSDSQRKFWNAWDMQHLQTVGEETRRWGDEVPGLISSLNLERPRILEIGCGNGCLAERLLSFGPVLLWHTPQPFHQRCQIRTVLFTHSLEL